MNKKAPNEFLFTIVALLVSIVIVHTIYVLHGDMLFGGPVAAPGAQLLEAFANIAGQGLDGGVSAVTLSPARIARAG